MHARARVCASARACTCLCVCATIHGYVRLRRRAQRRPRPHLHRDWAHPSHICAGTGRRRAQRRPRPPEVKLGHGIPCVMVGLSMFHIPWHSMVSHAARSPKKSYCIIDGIPRGRHRTAPGQYQFDTVPSSKDIRTKGTDDCTRASAGAQVWEPYRGTPCHRTPPPAARRAACDVRKSNVRRTTRTTRTTQRATRHPTTRNGQHTPFHPTRP
jgi:hypothetical protein